MKDLNAYRIFVIFYVFNKVKEKGGCALMHVYVLEHMTSLYYRTAYQ